MSLLSIIIPTYNSDKTLVRCFKSLVSQTFKDFEVIVMDGLSTDNTVAIAESFGSLLPHLIIKSEKDEGVYDAMNKGIALANGEWIYFLGSDDELFDQNVLSDVFLKNKDIVIQSDFVYGNVNSTHLGDGYDGEFDSLKICLTNICHQAIFCRKMIFEEYGCFDTRYFIHADWEFNIRCFFKDSIRKSWIEVVVANYATGGLSSMKDDDFLLNIMLVYEKNISKLKLSELLQALRTNYFETQDLKNNEIKALYAERQKLYQLYDEIHERDNQIHERDNQIHKLNGAIELFKSEIDYKNSYIVFLENNQLTLSTILKKMKKLFTFTK